MKKRQHNKNRRFSTFYLLPRNSFIIGMGSAFSLLGNYYRFNFTSSPGKNDLIALLNDWGTIGNDISQTIADNPAHKMIFPNDMPDSNKLENINNSSSEDFSHSESQEIVIPREAQRYIEKLPEDTKETVMALLVAVSYSKEWKAPIPPPDLIKEYNDVIPDGGNRILTLAEKQSKHRMEIEKMIVPGDIKQSSRGQFFAFIITIVFLLAAFGLVLLGHTLAGTIIGSLDILVLATLFIYGRNNQNRDSDHEIFKS